MNRASGRLERLNGFGRLHPGEATVYSPTSVAEIQDVLGLDRVISPRGAGRSYGDASTPVGDAAISLRRLNRILSWDPFAGVVDAEAGASLEDIWRYCLQDGAWFHVVSGTMKPTLGGAVSTNIHGKNNVSAGTFAEHVLDLDIVTADGNVRTLAPEAPEFWAVCGGLGLLGIITRVRFKLRKVVSGNVRVVNIAVRDWSEHSDQFEKYRSADYCVGWVDGFGRGRGVFQAAWHVETDEPVTMTHAYQDHFGRVGGLIPRNEAWKWMRLVTNRAAIRAANQAKWFAAKALPGEKFVPVAQYNFQLDYLPDWERAYVPMGLLQFQCCVPAEHAPHVFSQFESRWRQRCLEPFLIVMKQHRADPTVLRYLEDGFSVALDFRMTRLNTLDLQAMYQEFAEVAIDAGGHVYFAKDGVLRKDLAMKSLGEDAVSEFAKLKQKLDPDNRFRTALSDRIGLTA